MFGQSRTFAGMANNHPKVLVAPLDWGLGHATRCIPIIREILKAGAGVMISAAGGGKIILQETFPDCHFIDIPGINIRYPGNKNMALSMLLQIPGILKAIKSEHQQLEKFIDQHRITHIISDNRYGLYSKKIKSAFITHQVKIKGGKNFTFLEPLLFRANKYFIERFGELWIPDMPPPGNLSGDLSDVSGIKIPVKHLGILSRFKPGVHNTQKKFDFIALLSGPEPQRSMLEKVVMDFFSGTTKKCLLIKGLPGDQTTNQKGNVQILASIQTDELVKLLHPDTVLIARSGYSTLMDLVALNHTNVCLVPTPGQTEQEYLVELMQKNYALNIMSQDNPNFIKPGETTKPFTLRPDPDRLKKIVSDFIV